MTDDQLLQRFIRHRDGEAFRGLVQRHQPMVWAVCTRRLANPADREDAMQETFLKLARKARQVDQAVGPWLYRTANNTAIDLLRRKAARARHEQAGGELTLQHQAGATPRPSLAEQAVLDDAIAELSDDEQRVIVGYYFEQRSQRDLADQLGVNQSTVNRRINAVLVALRDKLTRRGVTVTATALAATLSTAQASAEAPASLTSSIVQQALAVSPGVANTFSGAIKMWIVSHKIVSGLAAAAITLAAGVGVAVVRGEPPAAPSVPAGEPATTAGAGESPGANGSMKDTGPALPLGVWAGTQDDTDLDRITVVWTGSTVRFEGTQPPRWYVADLTPREGDGGRLRFGLEITVASIDFLVGQPSAGIAEIDPDTSAMRLALAPPGQTELPTGFSGADGSRAYTLTRQPVSELLGRWVGGERGQPGPVVMTVFHDRLRSESIDTGEWYEASIQALDFAAEPATLDLAITGSSIEPLVGLGALAVLKLEDNTLTIAGLTPGSNQRPAGLDDEPGNRVFVFKRADGSE